MRRKLVVLTAFMCLAATGTAYAASPVADNGNINSYTGNMAVRGAAGTAAKPAPVAVTETFGMTSVTAGNVGAPLTDIKSTVYGVKAPNAARFTKCTVAQINGAGASTQKWDGVCAKASLIATGTVKAALVPVTANFLAADAIPCTLTLNVYNGGPGKLTFFFEITGADSCSDLQTGAAAAWQGTYGQSGPNLVMDTPEPADVSTNAGNLGGSLFASLQSETLNFKKLSVSVGKGKAKKTYPFLESVGCQKGSRPYSVQYTATTSSSLTPKYVGTVKAANKC